MKPVMLPKVPPKVPQDAALESKKVPSPMIRLLFLAALAGNPIGIPPRKRVKK